MSGRRIGGGWVALAGSLALLACEPTEVPAGGGSDPDTFTLTTSAASETWTEGGGTGASIYSKDALAGGIDVTLHVPEGAAPERFFFIVFDPPTTTPADVTARFTYVIGGVSWSSAGAPLHLTRANTIVFGHVAGSFADVVLTGPSGATMTVSGSFYAMFIDA